MTTTEEKTPAQLRKERADRARKQGRAATTKLRKPREEVKLTTPTLVVADTVERQASAALARVQEAEAKRGVQANGSTEVSALQKDLRASRTPVKAQSSSAPVAGTKGQHDFDVDGALKNMNADFILCRDIGHSWKPFHARWVAKDNAYESQLRCSVCAAIRTRWLSATGAQLAGHYEYTDGYLVKGMGRLTGTDRDKVRLFSVLNMVGG